MQLNVEPDANRYRFGKPANRRLSWHNCLRVRFLVCQPVENAQAEAVKLNQSALEFMLGAQTIALLGTGIFQ